MDEKQAPVKLSAEDELHLTAIVGEIKRGRGCRKIRLLKILTGNTVVVDRICPIEEMLLEEAEKYYRQQYHKKIEKEYPDDY